MRGCVYLVGAGCGRADLITLRGLRLLQCCDVVVYDDLIDRHLLEAAPQAAERLYVGKRLGRHSTPQEEISRLLVKKTLEGKVVVRLKGGDPFVFGRGGEEMEALLSAGIPCEEVPGITSAVAVPAAVGIPVTHRGVSRSFHVITGHTFDERGEPAGGWGTLANLEGTLVFLMGLANREGIADGLLSAGKRAETPAAVISSGMGPRPVAVRAPLAQLAEKTRAAELKAPAIILVGPTAALDFSATVEHPLSGVRVGVTGTAGLRQKLQELLTELGAVVETAAGLTVEELPLPLRLEALCAGRNPWLVFTSANGVDIFFRKARREGLDLRRLAACRFAVIGASTGRRLASHGIQADLCPATYTSAGLAEALKGRLEPGDQVVLLRSRQGTEVLPQLLARWGYEVRELSLYSLRGERTWDEKRPLDYLLFASAGGVEAFFAGGDVAEGAVCVCIGPVTARALAGHGYRTFLTAAEISAEGLVQAILRHHAGGEQAEGEPIREPELKDFRTGTRENKKGEST